MPIDTLQNYAFRRVRLVRGSAAPRFPISATIWNICARSRWSSIWAAAGLN